jgi:OOP family OmpA-OmpF porin
MAMKRVRHGPQIAAAAASLLVLTSLPALAEDQGNYFSVGGGYTIQETSHFSGPIDMRTKFNSGFGARAAIGHDFGMIRLEGEFGYRFNRAKSIAVTNAGGLAGVASGPATGSVRAMSYLVNAILDLDFGGKVTPYLGVGIGPTHLRLRNIAAGGAVTGATSDDAFSVQGIAGLAYQLSDRLDLTLDYRYLNAIGDIQMKDSLGRNFKAPYRNHAIMAGLIFRFGGKKAPAAEPVAQPAPPPPPPPAAEQAPPPPPPPPAPAPEKPSPQMFLVFFDFDSSAITAQGRQVIDQAVEAAKSNGSNMVIAIGYADRAGTETYNLALSKRRAEAVRKALVAQGVDDGKISIMAKGEADPLVPTPDGVREPQNRRVEIDIQ